MVGVIIRRFEKEKFNSKIPYKSVCSVYCDGKTLVFNSAEFMELSYRTNPDGSKNKVKLNDLWIKDFPTMFNLEIPS